MQKTMAPKFCLEGGEGDAVVVSLSVGEHVLVFSFRQKLSSPERLHPLQSSPFQNCIPLAPPPPPHPHPACQVLHQVLTKPPEQPPAAAQHPCPHFTDEETEWSRAHSKESRGAGAHTQGPGSLLVSALLGLASPPLG